MALKTIYTINHYLSFTLADEKYAINVEKVQSVLELPTIMKLPQTPDFMRGVINLRGNVVPVIDLKLKFGLGETGKTLDTAVIVMEIQMEDEQVIVGVLSDSVQEVIEILPEHIDPAPKLGTNLHSDFIYGMGKKEEEFLIVLDIDKVFTHEELQTAFPGQSYVKSKEEEVEEEQEEIEPGEADE